MKRAQLYALLQVRAGQVLQEIQADTVVVLALQGEEVVGALVTPTELTDRNDKKVATELRLFADWVESGKAGVTINSVELHAVQAAGAAGATGFYQHLDVDALRKRIEFFDTDKLREHYATALAELRAELARKEAMS